ncbi:hypothetical protein ACFV4E_22855 [Streptomyces hygroscopicus]|uniref:hypothetical protein n=1 Tax=Streptomyces hygroscopicus TaxID=1912 RepID=UPI0033F4C35F
MTDFHLTNGRFPDAPYLRLVIAAAALIAATITNSGPEYAAAFISLAKDLLPPGSHDPDQPQPTDGEA